MTFSEKDESGRLCFRWLKLSFTRKAAWILLSIVSGCILFVPSYFYPDIFSEFVFVECHISDATTVKVLDTGKFIKLMKETVDTEKIIRFFVNEVGYFTSSRNAWTVMKIPTQPEHFAERYINLTDTVGRPERK